MNSTNDKLPAVISSNRQTTMAMQLTMTIRLISFSAILCKNFIKPLLSFCFSPMERLRGAAGDLFFCRGVRPLPKGPGLHARDIPPIVVPGFQNMLLLVPDDIKGRVLPAGLPQRTSFYLTVRDPYAAVSHRTFNSFTPCGASFPHTFSELISPLESKTTVSTCSSLSKLMLISSSMIGSLNLMDFSHCPLGCRSG